MKSNRPPNESPLPAGEGWVRENFHMPPTSVATANPIAIPASTVIPALSRHSRPHSVIPAKAGIHAPAYRHAGVNRGSGFRPAPE